VDAAKLRAWLDSKPDDADVGTPGTETSCPLARYLVDSGFQFVRVNSAHVGCQFYDSMGFAVGMLSIDTPAWAARFVDTIDGLPKHRYFSPRDEVRAAEARKALAHAVNVSGMGQEAFEVYMEGAWKGGPCACGCGLAHDNP
jgi:hypothetical protein